MFQKCQKKNLIFTFFDKIKIIHFKRNCRCNLQTMINYELYTIILFFTITIVIDYLCKEIIIELFK